MSKGINVQPMNQSTNEARTPPMAATKVNPAERSIVIEAPDVPLLPLPLDEPLEPLEPVELVAV